jgi:hypothetical protein
MPLRRRAVRPVRGEDGAPTLPDEACRLAQGSSAALIRQRSERATGSLRLGPDERLQVQAAAVAVAEPPKPSR